MMNPTVSRLALSMALFLSSGSAALYAADSCDLERGARLFGKCAVCHANDQTTEGGVAPNLYHIIGRDIGGEAGFPYSAAMEAREGVWTEEALDKFVANPMTDMPGTMMAFAGFKKEQDRRDLICFLRR